MKKFYRIAVLVLIFCLCFTTAAFGADNGQNTVSADNHEHLFSCRQLPFAPGHEFPLVTLDDVAWRSGEYSGAPITEKIPAKYPHFDTPTEIPLLILVLEFNNIEYQDDYDWDDYVFTGDLSLVQYYKDMSFNQFNFVPAKETSAYNVGGNHNKKDKVNDGIVHVSVNANHGNWNLDYDDEIAKWIQCLVEGIKLSDDYVDYSSFDANNDGEITTDEMALGVIVAGYDSSYDYPNAPYGADFYIWPHAWSIYSGWYEYFQSQYADPEDFMPSPDGVVVSEYICMSEDMIPGWQENVSTLSHELGHYLGLPDLYDTRSNANSGSWKNYDASYLSVMCVGCWGWREDLQDYYPSAFDAWSRCCLGWVEPETVSTGIHNVVSEYGSEYNVLRIETGTPGDYYLLENREYEGWDEALNMSSANGWSPAYCYADHAPNGGLVCWHIDDAVYDQYAGSNSVNNGNHRPAVMPLYPEVSGGNVSFIGNLNADGRSRPFFTYDIWNRDYADTLDCIDFPTYNRSNSPSSRTFSGVQINILPNPDSHTVTIKFAGGDEIVRLSGKDRYDTGIAAAEELKEVMEWDKFQKVIVASGADFPDALSASYLAAKKNAPVILVGKDAASISKVSTYVNENLASGGTVYIVGGNGAVTPEFESALTGNVQRVKGANRFETNIEVLKEAGVSGEDLLVASGMNYADALSASAAGRPIFLVGAALNDAQKAYLEANKANFASTAYIIGGNGAVSEAIEADMKNYVAATKRVKGSDRFATSKAVADEFFTGDLENMVVASGMAFPDGLSGGPVALAYEAPLILVANNHYDHATELFKEKGAHRLIVMGGKGAVSKEIAETIAAPAKETA
ncbi:MAG: cell wall-binding repeat-containing protein [Clostridia bacterium]|nr:cell wall-binding repeat-containing protein [Clostridia bacterium]